MLRRDVDEAVVAAASHTPFEASFRVFVLERADTLNDEAANALLKTLEEPPHYVVLVLLTDRITQVLPTIASRCQGVRFDALGAEAVAQRLQSRGVAPDAALACARLSLGDGERALGLGLGDGPALRAHAEAFARAPLAGNAASAPWEPLLKTARERGRTAREQVEAALADELAYLPKKEHKKRETEFGERAKRAERRATTGALDQALQLIGLW
jgi:DNA polymerase-3 subunit delta'